MKPIYAVMTLSLLVGACGGQSMTGPSGITPTASSATAGGTLPSWMFASDGKLTRPEFGAYGVFAGPEITDNPQLREQLERTLASATDLTDGQVRFILTTDPKAPISFRLNASDPRLAPGTNVGLGDLQIRSSRCIGVHISIRDEKWFHTNVPLHELGHFLFGSGHSDTPEDVMNVTVRTYSRISFTSNEKMLWHTSLAFAPGTAY